jgi:glycosyltransferase involved in cell wall biosynthesis
MRILHVIPGLTRERGGPTAVVQALSRHQSVAGHDVTVLTTDQGIRRGEHAADLAAPVRLKRCRVLGPDRFAYAPTFRAAVREQLRRCDVVQVHSLFTYPVHVTLRESLALEKPLVLRPCGLLHPYSLRRSRRLKAAYLRLWGSLVRRACSAWHYTSTQEAADSWPGAGSHFVLPNGVQTDEYDTDRSAARDHVWNRWPEVERQPYVLFLARLHAKKRLDLLLEAFLAGAPEPYKLVIAGPDEEALWPQLSRRFLHGSAARRVVYVGAVTGADKVALLAGADLFALPSEHENFGNAALEALAAGTPVLLSPHVDLAGAVEPAGFGFTASMEASAWAERLAELLARPDQLAALAAPARAWTAKHYSWQRITAELLCQYRLLLKAIPNARYSSRQLPGLHPQRGRQPAALLGQPPLV